MHEFLCDCLSLLLYLSGVRLEEFIYEKVQGKRPVLLVDEGLLGQYMLQAGNQFDAGTAYGMNRIGIVFTWFYVYVFMCSAR